MMHADNTFEDAYLQTLGYEDDEPVVSVSAEIEPTEAITKKVCILTDSEDLLDLINKDVLTITVNVKGDDEKVTTVEIPAESLQVISVEDFEEDFEEVDFEKDEAETDADEEEEEDFEIEESEEDEIDEEDLIAEDEGEDEEELEID